MEEVEERDERLGKEHQEEEEEIEEETGDDFGLSLEETEEGEEEMSISDIETELAQLQEQVGSPVLLKSDSYIVK